MIILIYLIISFVSSIVGAICGIGGGVIIKPVLDMFELASVDTISFLSSCTVLSMSCYSVGKSILAHEKKVKISIGLPLAAGAAIGGIIGKQIFTILKSISGNQYGVGLIQATCLGIVTLGTIIYILNRHQIKTHETKSPVLCILIGFTLGILSSFLGIGGGPINLVVLYYFFSMDAKTAAANSLYIIFFSQIASLLTTLCTHTVPAFQFSSLLLMVAGGISGGITGRILNKKMDNHMVDKLLISVMVVIICICVYNIFQCIAKIV